MDELEQEKTRRLVSWYNGKKEGPFKIDIELHRQCNLNCLSCSRRNERDFENINQRSLLFEIPLERWLSIVDEAAELEVKEWHIAGGGDPPMRKELLFPVMRRIKKHDMHGILTTNGTNLTEEQLREIVEMGWDRIHFSIDGPDAKTHDYLRQVPGTFEKATGNIRKLADLKKTFGKASPVISINTVLSKANYNKLDLMVELAQRLDVEYLFMEPLIVYSEEGRKLKVEKDQMKEMQESLKRAIMLSSKYGIESNFSSIDKNLSDELVEKSSAMHEVVKKDSGEFEKGTLLATPCYDPWFHMTIKINGRATSCDLATDNEEYVTKKSLREIWFGPYFERHRKLLMEGNLPQYCAQCNPSHTTQRRRLRAMIQEGNCGKKKGRRVLSLVMERITGFGRKVR